jgi:hypothetical protein
MISTYAVINCVSLAEELFKDSVARQSIEYHKVSLAELAEKHVERQGIASFAGEVVTLQCYSLGMVGCMGRSSV